MPKSGTLVEEQRKGEVGSGAADTAETSAKGGIPKVPTTKVLAIGTADAPLTREQERDIMPAEVPATVKLYLAGEIEQWFVRTDGKGVVFLLDCASVDEAQNTLGDLPMVRAGLLRFEYTALGPLAPLATLFQRTEAGEQA